MDFFLENARKSLQSASFLYAGTTKKELQEAYGFEDFDGSLWIINSSYYSMFYMARALLANEGIKLYLIIMRNRKEAALHMKWG